MIEGVVDGAVGADHHLGEYWRNKATDRRLVILFPICMVSEILIMQKTHDASIPEHRKMVIAEAEKELLHLLDRMVFRDAQHMIGRDHDVAHRAFE